MINFKKMCLRIKRWLSRIRLRQNAVNTVVVCVVIALALYLAAQISRNISGTVSTLRAQQITDVQDLNLKGYIFRDEKVVYAAEGQVADYLVDNGERIGVGGQIAALYNSPTGADVQALQRELSALTSRIRTLESGISDAKKLSQSSQIFDEIDASYYAYLTAIQKGSFSVADKEGQLLLDALSSYMIATGRTEEAQSVVQSLREEKNAFISQKLSGNARPISVEQSCYFYTACDGYEGIFDYSRVFDITPAEFNSLTNAQKKEYTGAVGKQVFSPVWYICFPMSDELCDMFVNNATGDAAMTQYEASFLSNNGEKVLITFERAAYSDAAGNSGFAMFSCKQMPTGFEFLRAQNVQIELDSTTGYRVPEESLYKDGQNSFVYILNGNMVEKRRVTVIGRGDGYYIVNTYEADYSETGGNSELPYLAVNELIITSGRDLYDGKLLK